MYETLAEQWFRRVWNEGDLAAIDELLARNAVLHGLYGQVLRGPDGFRAFHAGLTAVFSRIRIEVLDEVGNGRHCAVRARAKLRHRATGRRLTLLGTSFIEVRSGQIVKGWNHWDFLGLLEGMKLMPEGSFEMAISGTLDAHPQAGGKARSGKKRTKKRRHGK